jgi:organic hydroperoxide reductase OsmC/OhrA
MPERASRVTLGSANEGAAMSTTRDYRFSARVEPRGGPHVVATTDGRPALPVATPAEFRGGVDDSWSPEHLLVASVASCFVLTFKAIAVRRALAYEALEVQATGHVTTRADGQIGFLAIELDVVVEARPEAAHAVDTVAHRAHDHCIVGNALAVPFELRLDVRTPALVGA